MDTSQNDINPEELWQAMQAALQAEEWETLIDVGEKLLNTKAATPEAKALLVEGYVKQAEKLYLQENEKALALCEQALKLDAHCADAYTLRGDIYRYSDLYEGQEGAALALASYNQAIRELTIQIGGNPSFAPLYTKRAKGYNKRTSAAEFIMLPGFGQVTPDMSQEIREGYERELADLTHAVELSPTDAEAYLLRAFAYCQPNSHVRDRDHALNDFDKAIEYGFEPLGGVYVSRGYLFTLEKQFDEALSSYERAIALGTVEAFSARGNIYVEIGQYARALMDFQTYITRSNASGYSGWLRFGYQIRRIVNSLLAENQDEEALAICQRIVGKLSDEDINTLGFAHDFFSSLVAILKYRIIHDTISRYVTPLILSKSHLELLRTDTLIKTLLEVRAKTRGDIHTSFNYELNALWYQLEMDNPDAVGGDRNYLISLASLMALFFPEEALRRRARIYEYDKKDNRKALNDYKALLDIVPDDPKLYARAADLYTQLNDFQMGISLYTEAIDLSGDAEASGEYYGGRAKVYQNMGDYGKAVEEYTVALRLNPGSDNAYGWLISRAWCYSMLKNWALAKLDYEELIRQNPDSEHLAGQLSEVERQLLRSA